VNWLTHAKNAVRLDAEIGFKAVEHMLGVFTAARLRHKHATIRCESCGSYGVAGGTCRSCGWADPTYEVPKPSKLSKAELARRLAEPCVPSSDISTLLTRDEVVGET
jgi:ribosomal protein L37E